MDVAQLRLTLGFNGDGNGVESAFARHPSGPDGLGAGINGDLSQ